MDYSGNFFVQNQQSNEQFMPPEMCFGCKCGTNFEEEVEKVFHRLMSPYLQSLQLLLQNSAMPQISSSSPCQAVPSAARTFLLKFKESVPDELLTLTKIEDEDCNLEVELLNEFGNRVEDGSASRMKIKIDALDGDFNVEDKDDWTEEDYNRNIAKPRITKGALLRGKTELVMDKGIVSVGHISFTDNSATRTNKTFRLGAKLIKGPPGVTVKAAVSEAFRVKERRLKRDKKHKIPSLTDDLWRLVRIRKDGATHTKALGAGVHTVKDFLQYNHTYPTELQHILDVSEANWNEIVKNAKACKLTNEGYEYYDVKSGNVLLLDCAFNIVTVTFGGEPCLYERLNDFQKEQADALRRSAYEKRSALAKINVPPKQMSGSLQGQEQPPPLPPPGRDSIVGVLWGSSNAGCVVTDQACFIPSTNVPSLDATTANQVDAVDHVSRRTPTPFRDSFQEKFLALCQDPLISEYWASDPQGGEESHVPQVAAHDHATSKLIAAFHVTKAASLFMISVQQDLSAPNKKRKL